MSITYIPLKVKLQLWAQSAGCCQYENCGKPLYLDSLTKKEFNISYIAHIVADQPDGPRGDSTLSELLRSDIGNLMLLCDEHHRLIDKVEVSQHTIERLTEMKRLHEDRITIAASMTSDRRTHIVLYGANIGMHGSPLSYREAATSISSRYPAVNRSVDLGIRNSMHSDDTEAFWVQQAEQLQLAFTRDVACLKGSHEVQHFSVFGLAPMPLLIKLGVLFSDIYDVDVYQRHREPVTWSWQSESGNYQDYFVLQSPSDFTGVPVLNISLSATITNDRIIALLGPKVSVWTLTHPSPHNDFLKSKTLLSEFRKIVRHSLDMIKRKHGQGVELSIFPSMPVSASIEFGRVWMPKADMPLVIYDQNNIAKSFIKTITINN
jgi:hypothetical protein